MTHHAVPSLPPECAETHRHLEALLDGEVQDVELAHRLRRHIAACDGCGAEARALATLEEMLRQVRREEPSARFLERIEDIGESALQGFGAPLRSHQMPWIIMAACALTLLVMLIALGRWASPDAADTLGIYVDDHLASLQPNEAVQFETGDPAELERWFAQRLPFAPHLPRWSAASLISGRLCLVDGQRVARVQCEVEGAPLSLFIRPLVSGDALNPGSSSPMTTLRGCCVLSWHRDDLVFVLVGPAQSRGVMERLREEARRPI